MALGLNVKYKEVSALTGEGVEDVSLVYIIDSVCGYFCKLWDAIQVYNVFMLKT